MHRFTILAACALAMLTSSLALAQTGKRGHHHFDHMLKRMDANHDGKLSRGEWAGKPKAFDRLDLNHDGFITRDEAEATLKRRAERREKTGRNFAALDKNNDGKISRDEWTGKAKAFDRLDLNHDGVLSRDELQSRRRRR